VLRVITVLFSLKAPTGNRGHVAKRARHRKMTAFNQSSSSSRGIVFIDPLRNSMCASALGAKLVGVTDPGVAVVILCPANRVSVMTLLIIVQSKYTYPFHKKKTLPLSRNQVAAYFCTIPTWFGYCGLGVTNPLV
jgi:hypothetical protein